MSRKDALSRCTKAVIFTHFGGLEYGKDTTAFNARKRKLIEDYTEIFTSYYQCNLRKNIIPLVYIYVDWAVKSTIYQRYSSTNKFKIDGDALAQENNLFGVLLTAQDDARKALKLDRSASPSFIHVGLQQLIDLLNSIVRVDPRLLKLLAGSNRIFTYDSPKFVEAVIRLARGSTAHLAIHPIIRIDEDVAVDAQSIERLIKEYLLTSRKKRFYFFSGIYGYPKNKNDYDPLNDHAVRVHWFAPVGVQPIILKRGRKKIPLSATAMDQIKIFLSDLDELGATQFANSSNSYSENLLRKLNSGRPKTMQRNSPQVISGAGLIMSHTAISILPPFTNFKKLTTWVDDYLKRRLHEIIGDISNDDCETVTEAIFQQDRYPLGVSNYRIEWAKDNYFERLLSGCIFRRLLSELDDTPTTYSKLIGDIVKYKILNKSAINLVKLNAEMLKQAKERYDEVISCWQSKEFQNTTSYAWAQSKPKGKQIYKDVVKDAMSYLDLVFKWPIFVRAIERLPFEGNLWLFEEVY